MRSASRAATLTCWWRTRAWGPAVRPLAQRRLWGCSLVLRGRRTACAQRRSLNTETVRVPSLADTLVLRLKPRIQRTHRGTLQLRFTWLLSGPTTGWLCTCGARGARTFLALLRLYIMWFACQALR